MTTATNTTRRHILTALPAARAAAVLPPAAQPENPMDRVLHHTRAIRDILRALNDDRR